MSGSEEEWRAAQGSAAAVLLECQLESLAERVARHLRPSLSSFPNGSGPSGVPAPNHGVQAVNAGQPATSGTLQY